MTDFPEHAHNFVITHRRVWQIFHVSVEQELDLLSLDSQPASSPAKYGSSYQLRASYTTLLKASTTRSEISEHELMDIYNSLRPVGLTLTHNTARKVVRDNPHGLYDRFDRDICEEIIIIKR